ncbi:hypothetical protein PoB_002246700 [Plakobranchus ocellatus]|uniref:Uncharacterized protein n=1 Tax=Plakobranchus ocellatus TaxID=259542 RepID=A0AAV3ZN55_9GAST|nr:hypothetical protein PoB_002246700 [Plakobranchus ocellatus]
MGRLGQEECRTCEANVLFHPVFITLSDYLPSPTRCQLENLLRCRKTAPELLKWKIEKFPADPDGIVASATLPSHPQTCPLLIDFPTNSETFGPQN